MNAILEAALEVQAFCSARGWRFCVIGAIAVQRWGEPRLTQDVDVTVLSGCGSEAEFRELEPLLDLRDDTHSLPRLQTILESTDPED